MYFHLEHHDPRAYRRKTRLISVAMAMQFIVFGLLFSQLLTAAFGSSLWLNALGVLLGLLATSLVFTVLRERPWMTEARYVWRLKHHLSQVSGYLPTLRRRVEEGDANALAVLSFYHQGMHQLAELNGRTPDDDAERLAERLKVRQRREEKGLPLEVDGFDSEDLRVFKRG
ncbi:hypothetical protein L861_21095 [Litchfieldella anticariensis FP35 = DSM 16096]|uniref:DUF3087 domain-containing protein n=1 Tax=Litchfieldella anticariensis (strain DSM 16096 / CECT 5854 / CIP 108499 / LMG 22089 / FP35) TaxID=1121939 RepID=S2LAJ4_LITA3|nr:DUF3087 family protein [Halomonas anticariensis]EPC01726.1 hypothetical protein L861_21095 [Halomonas anticariensis FP35 = DSM 16096]